MPNKATQIPGGYLFNDGAHQVEVLHPQRDRFGHLEADVRVLDITGAVLGQHQGIITSTRFRWDLATAAASRNSQDVGALDTLLLAVELELDAILGVAGQHLDLNGLEKWLHAQDTSYRYLVHGLFERGGLYLLTALAKSGKTLLAMCLLIALATRDEWLGRAVIRDKPLLQSVAIFAEDSPRTVARRFLRMLGQEPPEGIQLHVGRFQLGDTNLEETVAALQGVDLVYADPLLEVSQIADLNDAVQVRAALQPWRELARRLDCVVLIAHHHRKDALNQGARVLGSGQVTAGVDAWIEMDSPKGLAPGERRLSFTGRDWAPIPEQIITLDPQTLTFSLVGTMKDRKSQAGEAERKGKDTQLVLQVWEALPPNAMEGFTYGEVATALGWNRSKVSRVLASAGQGCFTLTGKAQSKVDPIRVHRGALPGGPTLAP